MSGTHTLAVSLDRIRLLLLVTAAVALLAFAAGGAFMPQQSFRSYLLACVFWIGLPLGSQVLLMLHHLLGGGWGVPIRPLLSCCSETIPLMGLLFVPLFFGLHYLYPWTHPEEITEQAAAKLAYLNVPFFIIRAIVYFCIWIGLTWLIRRFAADARRGRRPERSVRNVSAVGLILYGLTVTFASIDWVMSLEPDWFSTIYGLIFLIGMVLLALAFVIAALILLSETRAWRGSVTPPVLGDLGNLLLMFVMLWAYVAFAQYLIVWSANLPEEITWYLRRLEHGWQVLGVLLVAGHFFVPFLILLNRRAKREARVLLAIAAWVLGMRLIDVYWLVAPAFEATPLRVHWMDILALVGVGALWMGVFVWGLERMPPPMDVNPAV